MTIARFDSEVDMTYYRNGGILSMVIRKKRGLCLLSSKPSNLLKRGF